MELSPVNEMNENSEIEVDLCTPTENLKKHCLEITPDNPTKPEKGPLLAAKKVAAVRISQKLSKRKLFGQPVDQTSENESEVISKKKKKSDDSIITNDNTQKRLLTERQQLAFLLEATSTRESADNENESTFTKIATRKKAKRNGKCANPRVYRRNERGETLLHLAAIKGDIASLKKLIKDGAQVGLKDYAGWTALHEACNHGELEAAKLLIKHGAEVNVPGFEGDTPLHDAVVNNHVEVVNMLLSYAANPQQTNAKRKKPTDLISSKEMNDIFNLHGVKDTAFEERDIKIPSEESSTSGSAEKNCDSSIERSSHARSSILGNEIQRKETQGESKMEKPVMYICKLQPCNEDLTIRTAHVTSYMKCRNDEDIGRSRSKSSDNEGCRESDPKPGTLEKNIFAIEKENESKQVQSSPEDCHKVVEVVLEDEAPSSQVESHDQSPVQLETNVSMNASTSYSSKTAAKETEDEVVSSRDQDKVKAKIPSYDNENFASEGTDLSEDKQVSVHNKNTEPKLFISAGGSVELTNHSLEILERREDSVSTQENNYTKIDSSLNTPVSNNPLAQSLKKNVERSRTPEIDESIAVEVLSTGLFSGAPGFLQCFSPLKHQDKTVKNPSYLHGDVSVCTSGGMRYNTLRGPSYQDLPHVQSSLGKGLIKQDVVKQSSFSNDEPFLDVEGFEPDLEANHMEAHLQENEQSPNQLKDQENVVSSTSNYDDCTKTYLSNSHGGNSEADESENKLMSENMAMNTESEKTAIVEHSSEVKSTSLTSWRFDDTISKNTEETINTARTIQDKHDLDNFRAWHLETKARKRKKVGLKKSSFTGEEKTRQKSGQAISSGNQNTMTSWDTRNTTGLQSNSRSINENTRLLKRVTTTAVVRPSKPTVTWQSLMAAGRCQLAEVMVPGYDQFLMKTKQYELATNVNPEKSTEAPAHSRKEDISLKHKKSKEELLRKQRSEQDKLQLCMEQEIVRFYTKKAYSSLNCNQPPGVCTAIHWQNMLPRQLENEKKKLSQKLYMERDETSSSDHQEIIEKYEKLKSVMTNRHKHEQEALAAVTTSELRT